MNNAFGFILSWIAQQQIAANYTLDGQNLSGLSTGHTDFYIVFQALL